MYPESRNTFYFKDEFDTSDSSHGVNMVIRVKHNKSKTYYDIDYKYLYRCGYKCKLCHKCAPLHDNPESEDGEIIKQNAMTDKMILFMMMSDEDLSKYSGNSTPQRYRTNIIQSLRLFWD